MAYGIIQRDCCRAEALRARRGKDCGQRGANDFSAEEEDRAGQKVPRASRHARQAIAPKEPREEETPLGALSGAQDMKYLGEQVGGPDTIGARSHAHAFPFVSRQAL